MSVDTTRAKEIATQVRRMTTNMSVLELCDYVLAQGPQVVTPVRQAIVGKSDCPACAARRLAKAAAMKKWRSKS